MERICDLSEHSGGKRNNEVDGAPHYGEKNDGNGIDSLRKTNRSGQERTGTTTTTAEWHEVEKDFDGGKI